MLIDWFTLTAQIINFVLLVWLLKRFLWGKVVRAIDERENRIAARLADADEKTRQASRCMEELQACAAEQQAQREELMARARKEADELRLAMIQEARGRVRQQEAQWLEDLKRAQRTFLDEVRRCLMAQIMAVIRRALAELASTDVQRAAAEVLIERLRTIDAGSLRDLLADGAIAVRSASELPRELRGRIETVLGSRLGQPVHVDFIQDPAMSWGLELRSNGRCIGWNPESYLDSLEDGLRKALEPRPQVLVG
jgi:F-type H+-transporting ATPase subunit b